MNLNPVDGGPRYFLPRWHPSSFLDIEEKKTHINQNPQNLADTYSESLEAWRGEPGLLAAENLVSYAISTARVGEADVFAAAEYIVSKKTGRISEIQARLILNPAEITSTQSYDVARCRSLLKRYPNSGLVWADLAYFQCLHGQVDKARKSILTSLEVSKASPSIALPASRCLVHIDEPEIALKVIRKAYSETGDARLLCPEMSLSQMLSVRTSGPREALKIISQGNLPSRTDLALRAAFASDLVLSGSSKRAKKILATSLHEASENTLAQLIWLRDKLNIELELNARSLEEAHEAGARLAYLDKRFEECIDLTQKWSDFQPFSVTPICLGSYMAGLFCNDHERSLEFLARGKTIGPEVFAVWNNLAFDYAKLGRLIEAKRALSRAMRYASDEETHGVLAATSGLVEMRSGQVIEGRDLYRGAVKFFNKNGDRRHAAIASLMWAEEESNIGSSTAAALFSEAEAFAQDGNHVRVLDIIKSMKKALVKI